jgi:8-oxo-dGTP diphosphatase
MKKFDVVAAVILKSNKFFIAQRNRNKHMGLCWEFPGGKVEKNENFEQALKREIKEELNISILINKKIGVENYQDNKINVKLHYYLCSHIDGEFILNEHEDYAWVVKNEFNKYNFAEGDKDIISLL